MASFTPIAGLDPGRSKCGLVLSDAARRTIVAAGVLPPAATLEQLRRWQSATDLAGVVIGNGTGSRQWQQELQGTLPVWRVDERGSTLAARQRYWQLFPPQGWRRWLPQGLRQPPRDWDDVVAQLLLERWLQHPLSRAPGLTLLQEQLADGLERS